MAVHVEEMRIKFFNLFLNEPRNLEYVEASFWFQTVKAKPSGHDSEKSTHAVVRKRSFLLNNNSANQCTSAGVAAKI